MAQTIKTAAKNALKPDTVAAAKQSMKESGCPASITLAQFILESGWGKSMPPGSNNPFGIKAVKGQPFVTCKTEEVIGGKPVEIEQNFRAFDNVEQAFAEHGRLLMDPKGPYRHAAAIWFKTRDVFKFIDAMALVYATDRSYGPKLRELVAEQKLQQFDA